MAGSSSTNTESLSTASSNTDLSQTFMENSSETHTFVENKLTEWNLSDYIEIFQREKIDKSVFLFMPDEAVAKLIKPMGHYYKFIFEREKFKTSFITDECHSKITSKLPSYSKASGTCLRVLLKQSVQGKYLLKQSSLLNNSTDLAKIIIDHLLNKENKLKISRQQFLFWAHEITSIWCKEDVEKWYAPSKNGRSASGKLYYHYTNTIRKIKAAVKDFEQEEAKNVEKQIEKESELYVSELANTSLDDYKKISFLWEKTFDYCKNTCGNNIAEYFNRYPQLRPPLGILLIQLDFQLLNIAHINALQEKWPALHPKILQLATKQPAASNLLKDLDKDKVSPDVLAWQVFPYLFKPVLKKTGLPKKPWKPSYKEQSDGFITWINVITDIEKVLSTHRRLMSDYKLTLQPFVIVVLSVQKVEAAYVIINDEKYKFQDVTSAVAFCWKSFYVLNAAYPVSCEAVWIYIEEEIYEYKKVKRHYQSVKWVKESLENISCENTECESSTVVQLENKYIKMSAAEMKCFILNACLIFGDLVPRRNICWKLYILLRQIVTIVLQSTINNDDINLLEKLIEKHHMLYVKLFKDTLKPKHHFMVHYAHVMKIVGPLIHIWAMRFEAKHRPLKQSALMSNNRINLPLTIATKHQLHMSTLFLDHNIFEIPISYNKLRYTDERPIINLSHVVLNDYYQIKNVIIGNIKYDVDTIIKLSADNLPVYGLVTNIFQKNNNSNTSNCAFIVKILKCVEKDNHMQSYRLKDMEDYEFILYESLLFFEPRNSVVCSNGMLYIAYDNHMF